MPFLHKNHWPPGVPHDLRVPQVTLNHFVDTAALRYPDKPALIFAERVISYRELHQQIEAVAAFLQQRLGVTHGDRVLLMSQNCPQFVIAFYAVLRLGAVVVPVNPMSTLSEVTYFAHNSVPGHWLVKDVAVQASTLEKWSFLTHGEC